MFLPKTGIANWAEMMFKRPICYTEPLSSSIAVGVAVVDPNAHTCIDHLIFRLRETGEGACPLLCVRVSRGHLKGQLIGTEKETKQVRDRAANSGMTRRILRKIGCIDERLPIRIDDGR